MLVLSHKKIWDIPGPRGRSACCVDKPRPEVAGSMQLICVAWWLGKLRHLWARDSSSQVSAFHAKHMNAPLQYSLPLKFFLHFSLPRSIFSLSNGVCIFARIYTRYIELRGHPPTFFLLSEMYARIFDAILYSCINLFCTYTILPKCESKNQPGRRILQGNLLPPNSMLVFYLQYHKNFHAP